MVEDMTVALAVLDQVSALLRSLDDQDVRDLTSGRLVLAVQRRRDPPGPEDDSVAGRRGRPPVAGGLPPTGAGRATSTPTGVAGQPDAATVRRRLDAMGSWDEARAFLASLPGNKKSLQQLGRELGVRVGVSSRRDDMIDKIVNSAVGVRLDQEGIRRRATSP
jgi:hypothetical protein